MCYCPHMQVKLCLRKCPLKMVITTLQKLYWSILLTPTYESTHFSNNRCYLFLSFWPILLYLYFLEYKWDSIFSDVQVPIYIFFLHTLSKYSFPRYNFFYFYFVYGNFYHYAVKFKNFFFLHGFWPCDILRVPLQQ